MKSRKTHDITATKGDAQPYRLVGLAVNAVPEVTAAGAHHQRETLVAWSGSGWTRSGDGVYQTWRVDCADMARWWRAIVWGAKRRGVTWVIAHRAVRVASLMDLWRMIDRGQIQWDGGSGESGRGKQYRGAMPEVRRAVLPGDGHTRLESVVYVRGVQPVSAPGNLRGEPGEGGRRGESASVIIDDPPTILRLRVPGRPGRIWLMDIRNWGIEPEQEHASASAEADWIAVVMRRMVDELAARQWGGLKATAGSQALATWRRSYLTHNVQAHDDSEVLEVEEHAYVGGRCECARIGAVRGTLYAIDRRSAYAHACASASVPIAPRASVSVGLAARDATSARPERCIAECWLETDQPDYPCVRDGRVIYPVGRFSAVLAGPELAVAVAAGHVHSVGRVVEYHCEPALRDYALALWQARLDFDASQDGALSQWIKKLLVCLPGKLGQRCASWVAAPDYAPPAEWCAWMGWDRERGVHRLRALSGAVQLQERADWTYDAAPAIACWITSAARVELMRAIRAAGRDQCLYWDTDSLLLTEPGWESLQRCVGAVGPGLGQWRLVRTVARAILYGAKHYDHDGVVTCAGKPRTDMEATRLRDHYWYRQTFGQALHEEHPPVAARRLQKYTRPTSYTLGRIGDGGIVHPHYLEEW